MNNLKTGYVSSKALEAANKIADDFAPGFFNDDMVNQVAARIEEVYAEKTVPNRHQFGGTHGIPFYESRCLGIPFEPCTKEEYDSTADWNRRVTYPFTELEFEAIGALLALCYASWNACDNAEEIAQGNMLIPEHNYQELDVALTRIEALPDDQPGYVMEAAAKARWALRRLFDGN